MNQIVDNNRISYRQTYRLFLFDIIGVSTLLVPSFVAGEAGPVGVCAILLGAVLILLYYLLMKKAMDSMGNRCRCRWISILVRVVYGTVATTTAGYVAYLFAELMCKMLIKEASYWQVLFLLLIPSGYSVLGSIESRARTYEILFWPVLLCLFAAMFLALGDIQYQYYEIVELPGPGKVLRGAYLTFLTFGAVAYLPFFRGHVMHRKRLCGCVFWAILTGIGILLALYLVLVGSFGGRMLGTMDYPAVVLLENIQFTGGFVKRLDAFMVAIWFFTLYAMLNLNLFWGREMLLAGLKELPVRLRIGEKKLALVATVFLLANIFGTAMLIANMETFKRIIQGFFWYAVGPLMILIPVLCLVGCGATELEARSFPLLVAVDEKPGDIAGKIYVGVSYVMPILRSEPDASTVASEPETGMVWKSDFGGAMMACQDEMEKIADFNHLKVVLVSEAFWEDSESMGDLVDYLRQESEFPRNTYICVAKDVEEVLDLGESLATDLGTYLEEMIEKKAKEEDITWLTMGKLMDEQVNHTLEFDVAKIRVNNSKLSVNTSF